MEASSLIIVIIGGVILLLVCYVVGLYNRLVNAKNRVMKHFIKLEENMNNRFDLVFKLEEIAKDEDINESGLFREVTMARNKYLEAKSDNDKILINNKFDKTVDKFLALGDNYPKVGKRWKELLEEFNTNEDKINYAKVFYNEEVKRFNDVIEMFPMGIVANIFKYKKFEYFNLKDE